VSEAGRDGTRAGMQERKAERMQEMGMSEPSEEEEDPPEENEAASERRSGVRSRAAG
jgi:hypothetical protein